MAKVIANDQKLVDFGGQIETKPNDVRVFSSWVGVKIVQCSLSATDSRDPKSPKQCH